jgi:endonuclease/exonuclease/phosphatase family metal-dependent hydrolase
LASVLAWGSAPVRAEVRVLTQNMYVGASLGILPGLLAQYGPAGALAKFSDEVLKTKPAERAAAMAAEIAQQRPDFVALHEVWKLTVEGSVKMDLLQSLLDALQALGQPYAAVGIVTNEDVKVPTPLGLSELMDRDVILMRTDANIFFDPLSVQSPHFTKPIGTPFGPLTVGYVSVDALVRGLAFRFVSVHLIPDPNTILQHAQELLPLVTQDKTKLPLVFGGDFNTTADDPSHPSYPVYQALIGAGLTDAWNPRRPGSTCCQAPNLLNAQSTLSHRIDLILLRGGLAVEEINLIGNKQTDRTPSGLWPSDHAGIVATLAGPENQQ